jgi:O-antigen ligase
LALALLLLFRSRPFFLAFALLAVAFAVLNWNTLFPATYLPEAQGGSLLRPQIWYDVIRMTARSPLLGLGPANYEYYWYDPSFHSYSYEHANPWAWMTRRYSPPSHNMFVDIFAQTGLVGFTLFLWAIYALLRRVNQTRLGLPSGFLRAYAQGVFCGFVALLLASFAFADWLLPFVYNITIRGFQQSVYCWLLLGSVVPLLRTKGQADNG